MTESTNRMVYAECTNKDGSLTEAQIQQWKHEGFAFVNGIIEKEMIEQLRQIAETSFPAPNTEESLKFTDFGTPFNFPSCHKTFNDITLHKNLINQVASLLATTPTELRLSQSTLWPKYGRRAEEKQKNVNIQDNADQRIHVDYPNHTLVHPPRWEQPEAVEMIIYLSDHDGIGGSTAVVPRQGLDDVAYRWPIIDTPGVGELLYINDRNAAEAYVAEARPEISEFRANLYKREKYVAYRRGDILLYRHDLWHRGSPLKEQTVSGPGIIRFAQNLTFRKHKSEVRFKFIVDFKYLLSI